MRETEVREALLSATAPGGSLSRVPSREGAGWPPASALRDDPELAEAWSGVQAAPTPSAVRRLAGMLVRRSEADEAFRAALERWLLQQAPPGGGLPAASSNTLTGAVRIWGPALQAGEIHGGVHVHHGAYAAPQPVPRQLPPASAHFVDRERDLAALRRLRAAHAGPHPQLIVVSGPAGVGKTALVTRWLGGMAEDFSDGQLYADLAGFAATGPLSPREVLEQFLRATGARDVPVRMGEMVALWRTLTATRRVAVMLDNALTAAQVRPLLPAAAGSLVVVTSRRQLTGLLVDGAELHRVRALEPSAAVELLHRAGGGSRVAQDREAAHHVVSLCAFLPLAVCLAGAQLAARPRQAVSAMADLLSRADGLLDALQVEGEAAVRVALDASYRTLAAEAALVYRRMGLLPVARFGTPLAAAACGLTPPAAGEALNALFDSNLLEQIGEEDYRFHDLVRQHARSTADAGEPREAHQETLRRFVDWCLSSATAAEARLSSRHPELGRDYVHHPAAPVRFGDQEAALRWLDAHLATLMAAVRLCADAGWDVACWQLVDAMWPAFLRLRPAGLWVEAHEVGLAAARRCGDRRAVGRMLTSGGNGLRNIGRYEEAVAWYTMARQYAEQDGDIRQVAQTVQGTGSARLACGLLDEAEMLFTQALELRQEVGYHRGAALSRLSLGEVSLRRGHYETACRHLLRAHRELIDAGDTYDAARALAFLGLAGALGGDAGLGRERLLRALGEMETAGSRQWQARVLEMLGQAAQHRGATVEAREWFERSLAMYRAVRPGEAQRVEGRLGSL